MKKLFIILVVLVSYTCCKGPSSGPLVKESFDKKEQPAAMGGQKQMTKVVVEKANVKIEPCADCITIAKLIAGRQSYAGKTIKVKGQVTKYNSGIMGKNWIHIQDGSEFDGSYDLTVTTDISTAVGQIVTMEGKIAIDKDFGYGYAYNVIMEDAISVQ